MTPCTDLEHRCPLTLTPQIEEHYDTLGHSLSKGHQWAAHSIFSNFAHLVVLVLQDSSTSNGTDACRKALRPQQSLGSTHHACMGQVAQCARLVSARHHLCKQGPDSTARHPHMRNKTVDAATVSYLSSDCDDLVLAEYVCLRYTHQRPQPHGACGGPCGGVHHPCLPAESCPADPCRPAGPCRCRFP